MVIFFFNLDYNCVFHQCNAFYILPFDSFSCQMFCCTASILQTWTKGSGVSSGFQSSINDFIILLSITEAAWGLFTQINSYHWTTGLILRMYWDQWSLPLTWIITGHQMPILISRSMQQKLGRDQQKYLHKPMRWIVRFDFLGFTVVQRSRFMCKSCGWDGSSTLGESKPIGVMNCSLNLIDHLLCWLFAEWHHY